MDEKIKPIDPETVACDVCMKESPLSEAKSEEASDYVLHYCIIALLQSRMLCEMERTEREKAA